MKFYDKRRYARPFQYVTHKGGESAMNYINILQNLQDLSVSVENSYTEDHLMHIFLSNFHQGGKYTSYIASHQAELIKEEEFTYQKYLSISSIYADYLNLDRSSGRK